MTDQTNKERAIRDAFEDSRRQGLNTDWFTFQIAWAYADAALSASAPEEHVSYPKREDVTLIMRKSFERLYVDARRQDHSYLNRNEQGAYSNLRVDDDWIFYQRAWADALSASAPATAPIEALSSECNECGGTGLRDLGGFYPWGEPTMIECDCISKMPTPNAPAAGSVPSYDLLNKLIELGAVAKGHHVQSMSDDGHAGTDAASKWWDVREEMRALLDKYGSSAWQPIETAPAGKRVLLGPREAPVVGIVDFYEDEATGEKAPHARVVHYNGGIFVSRYHCSEWMPLPPAPQEGK